MPNGDLHASFDGIQVRKIPLPLYVPRNQLSQQPNNQLNSEKSETENLRKQIQKLQENQINVQNANGKIIDENKKLLEGVQMVGKIFNEVSNANCEIKTLIKRVNVALGLPEIEKDIPFDLEIKKEIKNEIKIEVDDSKFDQDQDPDPDQHTIYFDFD